MSNGRAKIEIPEDKKRVIEESRRLEIWSLGLLVTIVIVLGLTMGSSQAMKAMWLEDLLSLIPTSAVLIGIYMRKWQPDDRFNYGYRRSVQIGFLASAVALFGFGVYLLGDSVYSLVSAQRSTIQTISIFGTRIWLGWLMIAALVYSIIPPFVLGRMKKPHADELHDKALYTSAMIDKGDWLSGGAGIVGILGLAFGYWWADSAAAAFISFEIASDGWESLKNSTLQLMDMQPTSVVGKEPDPVIQQVKSEIDGLDWVRASQVRLREEGDILGGEAFVVPSNEERLIERLAEAAERIRKLDWRLQDFVIVPVRSLE